MEVNGRERRTEGLESEDRGRRKITVSLIEGRRMVDYSVGRGFMIGVSETTQSMRENGEKRRRKEKRRDVGDELDQFEGKVEGWMQRNGQLEKEFSELKRRLDDEEEWKKSKQSLKMEREINGERREGKAGERLDRGYSENRIKAPAKRYQESRIYPKLSAESTEIVERKQMNEKGPNNMREESEWKRDRKNNLYSNEKIDKERRASPRTKETGSKLPRIEEILSSLRESNNSRDERSYQRKNDELRLKQTSSVQELMRSSNMIRPCSKCDGLKRELEKLKADNRAREREDEKDMRRLGDEFKREMGKMLDENTTLLSENQKFKKREADFIFDLHELQEQ